MCLGVWSKHGFVKDTDVMSVAALPELYGEEEKLEAGWDKIA
jgi:hypothetical protein